MSILEKIAESRLRRVRESERKRPLEALRAAARALPPAVDALARLSRWPRERRAVLAEVKRRSPSKGLLRPDLDPAALAQDYERGGAFAVSVLTEPDHFGGSLEDLSRVREAVGLPVLYKDFVSDPYQVWEARARGADLVLLIAALLGDETRKYVALARAAGLEPLVEVHGPGELEVALAAGARLLGINNRDLRSLRVDLAVSRELLPRVPAGVWAVSESGLRGPEDLESLAGLGAHAFLIGEALVTAPEPGVALAKLVGGGPSGGGPRG